MKTNNIKKYLWIIVLITLLPVVFNFILLIPRFTPVVGGSVNWLPFWGGYLGAIVSASVAFFVLHKQLKQNHEENESSRNLQLNTIKYQQQMQWLNELKVKLTDYYSAFGYNDISFLGNKIINTTDKKQIRDDIKIILDRMFVADFSRGVLFPKNTDSKEDEYLTTIGSYTNEFYAMLNDLDWYVFKVAYYNGGVEMNHKMYMDKTNKYKNEKHIHKSQSRRIWKIIESYNYDIFDKHKMIIAKRMKEATDNFLAENVQKIIVSLIDYEQEKINKIITE